MKRVFTFILIITLALNLISCKDEELVEDIPILLYHSIVEELGEEHDKAMHVSLENFKKDLDYLKSEGYETISLSELYKYYSGEEVYLPEKPVVITFDDGYLDNYTLAFPILKDYGARAVINLIGWSVGRDSHIDSDKAINPHFSWDQAKEMLNTGLIEFGSHSFDLHNLEGKSYGYKNMAGLGLLSYDGESEEHYRKRIYEDLKRSKDEMEENLGVEIDTIAYPYGQINDIAIEEIKKLGFKMGFVIDRESPSESIFEIRRISIRDDLRVKDMIGR